MSEHGMKLHEDVGYLKGRVDELCSWKETFESKVEKKLDHIDLCLDRFGKDFFYQKGRIAAVFAIIGASFSYALGRLFGAK